MGGTVYLLHFLQPIGNPTNPRGQAQHYIGFSRSPTDRIIRHTAGHGARIVAYVQAQGIGFLIVATWPGDRTLERQLKRRKNARRLCLVCQEGDKQP